MARRKPESKLIQLWQWPRLQSATGFISPFRPATVKAAQKRLQSAVPDMAALPPRFTGAVLAHAPQGGAVVIPNPPDAPDVPQP